MPKFFNDIFKGEGVSQYDQTGFDATSNLDTSSVVGVAQCQFALVLDNSTINEPAYLCQDASGNLFAFSATTGKVWKRAISNGAITLEHTNANGAHYSCRYFNGIIYFTTHGNVGSYNLTSLVWTDSIGTLDNNGSYHPMEETNNILHIGDGNDVSSVDALGTFNQSALDLPANYTLTSLLNDNSYLLNGTMVSTNIIEAKAFYWDTYSSSWTFDDALLSILFFIKCDNDVFILAKPIHGTDSWIYFWNGNKAERYRPLRGVLGSVGVQSVALYGEKTLFAVGRYIYSLYKPAGGYAYGLIREYTADGTIQSIMALGSQLYVSTASGLYKIDTATRATAYFTIPIYEDVINGIEVPYETLNGCTLSLETSINGADFVTETAFVNDPSNQRYFLRTGPSYNGHITFGKARITLNPVADQTPKVKGAYVY